MVSMKIMHQDSVVSPQNGVWYYTSSEFHLCIYVHSKLYICKRRKCIDNKIIIHCDMSKDKCYTVENNGTKVKYM